MSLFPLFPKSFLAFFNPLLPLRRWVNNLEVSSVTTAQWICRVIPNTCSSGYDFTVFGRISLHVPSLCKLNPLADELVDLRFRAADFLYEQNS